MANGVFDFKGGPELKRELKKMEQRFLREMGSVIKEEAETIMSLGKASAPRLSGELMAGTDVTIVKGKERVEAAASFTRDRAAAVHEGVHWGRKVEGTEGFHWFGDEAEAWLPKAHKRIVERLRAITREPAGGAGAPAGRKRRRPAVSKQLRAAQRRLKSFKRGAKKALKTARKMGKQLSRKFKRRRR